MFKEILFGDPLFTAFVVGSIGVTIFALMNPSPKAGNKNNYSDLKYDISRLQGENSEL